MTHISGSMGDDRDLFSDFPGAGVEPRAAAEPVAMNEANVVKALAVIQSLLAAGKRSPFDFDLENAKMLWGARLAPYPLELLMAAANEYIAVPGPDWPTVGDVETTAKFILNERQREERMRGDDTAGPCPECEGVRFIRVPDHAINTDGPHHMQPCSTCPDMRERYEAYMDGHWSPDHEPCGRCMKWRDPPRWKRRQKATAGRR